MGEGRSQPTRHEQRLPSWRATCQSPISLPVHRNQLNYPQTLLSILIGPAAARPGGQSSGAGGHADILNIQTLTVPSLTFGATVVGSLLQAPHYCLTSLNRHASLCLPSKSAIGRSRVAHQDSTIWHSTNELSRPLESGTISDSGHFLCGGIGAL